MVIDSACFVSKNHLNPYHSWSDLHYITDHGGTLGHLPLNKESIRGEKDAGVDVNISLFLKILPVYLFELNW